MNGAAPGGAVKVKPPLYALDDENVPIVWRIAFTLLAHPVLDYQAVAATLWGPDLDKDKAKNRVNAHMSHLKTLGVVTALGGNRYQVNKELLAKHSKLPVEPVEASS